jgi:N-acetylmuramoyl-L-alanine amidase
MHEARVRGAPTAVRPLWTCPQFVVALATVVGLVALAALVSSSSPISAALSRASTARRMAAGRAVDPRYFEPGACVEYAPTSGDRHLTVFLDAGHGGIDPGGVGETEAGQTIYEENETLPVELDTAKLLEAQGFTVVVSRTGNELVGRPQPGDISGGLLTVQGDHNAVAARDVCANMARADILIGIYFDAGASPDNAGAVTGYDTARPFSAQNLKLATLVQNDVLGAMNAQGWGIPDLGVTDDSQLGGPPLSAAAADYGHLLLLGPPEAGWFATPSEMPGALIEPLFITDPFEGNFAASTSGQEVIARGLALAAEQYFAPAPDSVDHAKTAAPGTRARVRVRSGRVRSRPSGGRPRSRRRPARSNR